MAFAFWAALQPDLAPPGAFGADKVVHVATFAFLAHLGMAASATGRAAVLWALGLAMLGVGIEVAQCFVPEREASLADVAGDWVGIAAGVTASRLTLGRLARHLLELQPL